MKQPIPLHKGHVPFVRFLAALALGIITSYLYEPDRNLYAATCGVLIVSLFAFVCMALYTRFRQQRYYGLMGFFVFLILFTWGHVSTWRTHPEIDQFHFSRGDYRALIGKVIDEPVIRGDRLRFSLEVTKAYGEEGITYAGGKLMITVTLQESRNLQANYGDEFLVPARYREIPPPYNPGELDYRGYLANKNIWHQSYFSLTEIQKIASGKGNPLVARALKFRKHLVAKFERYLPDKDAFSVASTLILGYRADLSEELLQAFSHTGTIHVLSVSGMHVVIVFWLFSKLMGWMGKRGKFRVVNAIVSMVAVWSYAVLTGFSPSVLRASLMISFVISASAFRQENRIYNSISASAFFLLLHDPKFMADIGFQLSYLAVLGIVFLAPLSRLGFLPKHRLINPIGKYVWMSVSAQAGAGPLATFYFHQFPLYFLVANLFIVLPVSGIMYLGFALLILPEGALVLLVGGLLEKGILAVNSILYRIEQLPQATIGGIWLTEWDCLLIYLLFFSVALALLYRSKFWFCSGGLVLFILLAASSISRIRTYYHREIIIFNVKQDIAIGLINKGKAWVYSNLVSLDNRTIGYAVLPGLERLVPPDQIYFASQDSSYNTELIFIKNKLIQFGDTRIMVYDGDETYEGQLEVDILLVRNNPKIPLVELLNTVRCKQLVIDGSNHRTTIERLIREAKANQIPLYVLKDNFAWTRTGISMRLALFRAD